ncbi:MAG TPA: sulfotransferase domain-containing protein [Pirellulales bacterium]|nr:sulfotransferase domain-containing protein [Pirellulales bacterium]
MDIFFHDAAGDGKAASINPAPPFWFGHHWRNILDCRPFKSMAQPPPVAELAVTGVSVSQGDINGGVRLREQVGPLAIIGLPKCGNQFFARCMQQTLGCEQISFCTTTNMIQQIIPQKLAEFAASPRAVGGQHLPPTTYNLRMLQTAGIDRVVLLFRDPRDAVISWWRHLDRPDVRDSQWRKILFAAGFQCRNYYDLSASEKLADLIDHMYPAMQRWMSDWSAVVDAPGPFRFHINLYESFVAEPAAAVRQVLQFFGHDCEPVLPNAGKRNEVGIDPETHLRRGKVGSFRDETPSQELIDRLNAQLDRTLAKRFGWKL